MFPHTDVERHVRWLIQDITNIQDKRWLRVAIISHVMRYYTGKVTRNQQYKVEEVIDSVCQWNEDN